MKKHQIEIAVDTVEAESFKIWLIDNGHNAEIGTSTGNYVDGEWTSCDPNANEIMNNLWDEYCKS